MVAGLMKFSRMVSKCKPSFLRSFSACAKNETCVVMGEYGLIDFPLARATPISEYVQKNPFVVPVPVDRIYGNLKERCPVMADDANRHVSWSAILLPYYSAKSNMSAGAFDMENVVVIEELSLLAFKNLEEDPELKWLKDNAAGYHECAAFLEHLFLQSCSTLPLELKVLLFNLRASLANGESLIDHPCLFTNIQFGDFVTEIHRLLRHEYEVTRKAYVGFKILSEIGDVHQDCVSVAQNNALLNVFLPQFLQVHCYMEAVMLKQGFIVDAVPENSLAKDPLLRNGIRLVDICRNAAVHSVEAGNKWVSKSFGLVAAKSMVLNHFTRMEVLTLLRNSFGLLLPQAFYGFRKYNEFSALKVRERRPIPSIYLAPGR